MPKSRLKKARRFNRLQTLGLVGLIGICGLAAGLLIYSKLQKPFSPLTAQQIAEQAAAHAAKTASASANVVQSSASATVAATPSASPKLSFAQLNKQFGPCTQLPVLMYHHVEDLTKAKAEGHAQLTVGTNFFRADMQYLKDKKYNVIKMTDLLSFFDENKPLPPKPVLLTFDDGYVDFSTDAWPILQEFNYPGTMFVPTGLIENPDYMTWSMVTDIASHGLVLMANHTWSHHSMAAASPIIEKEIGTARQQLKDHSLDEPQVFAYPYGTTSPASIKYLQQVGYQLAFTTVQGSTECKGQRLTLPRIRIGNAPLSNYGL